MRQLHIVISEAQTWLNPVISLFLECLDMWADSELNRLLSA